MQRKSLNPFNITTMAIENIKFTFPVESINRKLTLRRNTASSEMKVSTEGGVRVAVKKPVSRYFGSGTRKSLRKGVGAVYTNYLFVRFNERSTPASQDENLARARFGFCTTRTQVLRKALSQIPTINANYNNGVTVKDVSPYGLTIYQYILRVCIAQYDDDEVTQTTSPNYAIWPGA